MTSDAALTELEGCLKALAEEERLARAGLKPAPALEAALEPRAELFSRETVSAMRERVGAALDRRERERAERALFAVLEGSARRQAAKIEEDLWRERTKAGWQDLAHRAARDRDPGVREAAFQERARIAEKLGPKAAELDRVRRKAFAAFGFSSARDLAETKSRLSYETFLSKTIPLLEDTTGLYRRVLSEAAGAVFGRELGTVPAAHAEFFFGRREDDRLFADDRLPHLCKDAFERVGLDLDRASAIDIDLEDRSGKDAEAVSVPVDPPKRVHLLLRPRGGYPDVRSFMCEGGRSLAFAYADPALPFELRALPRSSALSRTFGAVFEQLASDPLWLEHVLRLPKEDAARLSAWGLLGELYRLRLSIARLSAALAFDASPYDGPRNRKAYAATLADLTGFVHDGAHHLEDFDPRFEEADDLRARIAASQVTDHLVRAYGDRWFFRRETGAFLRQLFAKGASWEAEELVADLGMTRWDPLPLIRRFDGVRRLLR